MAYEHSKFGPNKFIVGKDKLYYKFDSLYIYVCEWDGFYKHKYISVVIFYYKGQKLCEIE